VNGPLSVVEERGKLSNTNSSKFEAEVPEKFQGSFKYVEQQNTLRTTLRQLCSEGLNTTTLINKNMNELLPVSQNVSAYLNEGTRIWYSGDQLMEAELMSQLNGFNKSCTEFTTLSRETVAIIENFLSYITEVFEVTNMSNIGTRHMKKLLRLLRRTVGLKEQWEQIAEYSDDCFSLQALFFIKASPLNVTDCIKDIMPMQHVPTFQNVF
jgi:hypothetical protein